MSSTAPALPEALQGRKQLAPGEEFCFGCHPGVACFNHCCADINILLTPLDVLRLSRRLGMSTGEFLRSHTMTPITKDLHLPVVMLKMSEEEGRRCHFVGEKGCTVYEDRPWACRMYPLGIAVPPARAGEQPEPIHVLFEDDFCHGREEPTRWTVEAWCRDQGVDEREELESGFRAVVSHPWFIGGRQLDPRRMDMFFTAYYDLDAFREFIFQTSFLERFELAPELAEALRHDDEALLRFATTWLRFALFAEPTMKVRPGAPSDRRKR